MNDIPHLADELSKLGARYVFGVPGEGASLLLISELEKVGCTFHLVSNEAAGALLAGGVGKVAGVPGIALSIKGPGFSNMLAGIASNWLDRNPALSLSESYGPGSSPFRVHKRLDHAGMVRPVVKAYADNVSPAMLPDLWKLSMAEEPGPVHLDISERMDRTMDLSGVAETSKSSCFSEIRLRLHAAKRPLVIAGELATRRAWRAELAKLVIPVLTTVAGKGAIDETLPYSGGVFTNSGGPYAPESRLLPRADLIIGMGLRTQEIIDVKALPVPLIVVDEIGETAHGLEPAIQALGNDESFCELLAMLQKKEWGLEELAAAKNLLEQKLDSRTWLPSQAFQIAQRDLTDTTVFMLDTGSFCIIGEHVLVARRPLHVMGSARGRSMGLGLPTAVGAAMVRQDIPMVVVLGDGGARMYPDTIGFAVRQKLPMLVILMTDGFFSSIRKAAVIKNLRVGLTRAPCERWTTLFEAWGCPAERVGSEAEFENAIKRWDISSGPLFLELAFDADAYMAMTEGIR